MKILKIKDRMYYRDIYVVIECSSEEFSKHIEKKYDIEKDEDNGPSAKFLKVYNESKGFCHYYIWTRRFDWRLFEYAILTHEINHLVFEVMRDVGIEFCKKSEEAHTYYMQRITTDILLAIDEYNEKIKKKKSKKAKKGGKTKTDNNGKNKG